jgi:hypothetical protein
VTQTGGYKSSVLKHIVCFYIPYLECSVHAPPQTYSCLCYLQEGSMSVFAIVFQFFHSFAFSFRFDWKLWEVLSCSDMVP